MYTHTHIHIRPLYPFSQLVAHFSLSEVKVQIYLNPIDITIYLVAE